MSNLTIVCIFSTSKIESKSYSVFSKYKTFSVISSSNKFKIVAYSEWNLVALTFPISTQLYYVIPFIDNIIISNLINRK